MGKTIAISGKGGVGKTAIAAGLIDELARQYAVALPQPRILAVDADPAANLYLVLGAPEPAYIGNVREGITQATKSGQMRGRNPRAELEAGVATALTHTQGYDLIAMGRPEGPGCYCTPNKIIREALTILVAQYDYTVIDTEAGMEHLSRQTATALDVLVLVFDQTVRAARTALDAAQLVQALGTPVGKVLFVLNRAPAQAEAAAIAALPAVALVREQGYAVPFTFPEDGTLTRLDREGVPLAQLPADSPFRQMCQRLLQHILGL